MGKEEFYLLIFPALLWSYDASLGFRLGLILLSSSLLNSLLKQSFGWPRPSWVSEEVRALSEETSFGLPSGHAQNAASVWGRLAAWLRRTWAFAAFGSLIFLISLSRLQLGVHFPSDVLAGLAIGGVLLWVFLKLEGPGRRWLNERSLYARILAAFLASIGLLSLNLVVSGALRSRPTALALPANASPYSPSPAVALSGALFGLAAGGALLFAREDFQAGGPIWGRLARYVLGILGVILIFYGLRAAFPEGEDLLSQALRYLRYAAVGFWITFLAPRVFIHLRLA
ncbi:MAG: phosphatase PAP2 family protein [Anaerolineae bacterium]|nr:phosphatase PAP2 family protein [Anaerolineae bacterium]NIN96434.1 phosphatase PAP2 family protein [Anaerolineae bacterium]